MQTTKVLSLAVLFSATVLSAACSKREEAPVTPATPPTEAPAPAPTPVPPPPLPEASVPSAPSATIPPVDPASAPASGSPS
jgi:hypothetical protein